MKPKAPRAALIAAGALVVAAIALTGCLGGPTPQAQFTATPRFDYPPLIVSFDASASSSPNGAILSYEWDFGDGDSTVGMTATHTYAEKGVYTVTLVITDSAGKTGARSLSVEAMNRLPVADFSVDKYWVGTNDPLEFDASSSYDPDGTILQYVWSFGDGTTGEGMIAEHEYGTAGGGGWQPTVTLTVIDDSGDSGSTSQRVNVVGCDACGG
ncbi:PKD domain-containing protein [Candidatus Bipolaricaulota bacterium]